VSYHDTLAKLTDRTSSQVLATFAGWKEGKFTDDQFVQLVSAFIASSNGRAVALADLSLAAEISVQLQSIEPALGVVSAADDQTRLAKGAATLAAESKAGIDITDRLARFAHSEASAAAANAYAEGIARTEKVTGWVRKLDGDPCQLCTWWWREGQVWPKDHKMPHHKGCQCTPKPVTYERTAR
jgi:hypothetical protein